MFAEKTPDEKFIRMMTQQQQQVTNAVREQIHRHLPKDVVGPVGNAIRDCLKEVREYHWKDHEKMTETWAYELEFVIDDESVILKKDFTLNKIVTDQVLNDGTYAIPYSNILGCLILTEDEVALLATAI